MRDGSHGRGAGEKRREAPVTRTARRSHTKCDTLCKVSSRWVWPALVLLGASSACSREALDDLCPAVQAGGLVVTEVRGDQSGEDAYGEWLEIYNASGAAVDLEGLEIVLRRVDGGASGTILVRDAVPVDSGAYAVIGRFAAGNTAPEHIDYGYTIPCEESASGCDEKWLDTSFYNAAAIDLIACGQLIDRAIYRDLPSRGSWSYDGAMAPTAEGNDTEAAWCADDTEDADTPTQGYRGTPGQENIPCG